MCKCNTSKHRSQASIASQIEDLVNLLRRTEGSVMRHSRHGQRKVTKLARHFEHIEQMVALFDGNDDYDYSPPLQVFKEALCDVGVERSLPGMISIDEDRGLYDSTADTLNALAERIRYLTSSREYRRQVAKRLYAQRRNCIRYEAYADSVLDIYARTLVVRVDLHYRSDANARLRAEHVFDDLQRLIRACERDQVFEHEIGYVVGVEQGKDRGYHIHMALFYDGAKVRGDVYMGRQMGELWQRVTRGRGTYHNCNQNKEERYREALGIGLVYRDDEHKRANTLQAIRYLVKDTQWLSLKPKGARCLRKGMKWRTE